MSFTAISLIDRIDNFNPDVLFHFDPLPHFLHLISSPLLSPQSNLAHLKHLFFFLLYLSPAAFFFSLSAASIAFVLFQSSFHLYSSLLILFFREKETTEHISKCHQAELEMLKLTDSLQIGGVGEEKGCKGTDHPYELL